MSRSRPMRVLSALLVVRLLSAGVPIVALAPDARALAAADSVSTGPSPADTAGVAPLEQARALLREGDYDRSIQVLKPALAEATGDPDRLRETYLLLIKTYVFLGNDLKFKPQGREASNLNYQEARRLIAECLGIRELRHLEPVPESQYPPEMVAFFLETRRAIFGAFRVREVVPAGALVRFDGDTLRAAPGDTLPGDVDIAIGPHVVVVSAPGFKPVTDHITIAADVTLERSYRLEKQRGGMWYATRGLGALAVVGGVILAIGGKNGDETTPPLPGPPDPPTSRLKR